MKRLLLLTLCLLLPFQGFAALVAFEPPCPMAMSAGSDAEAVSVDAMASDCCNDADTVAQTGELCKSGQECSSGGPGLLFPPMMQAVAPVAAERFTLLSLFIPRLFLDGLWRPPTQL